MASIRQCRATLAQHRHAFLIVSGGRVSVVCEGLNFNGPRASWETCAILVEPPPSPGLLSPCPVNYPRGGFSHRTSYSGTVHTVNDVVSSLRLPADVRTSSRSRAAITSN